MLERARFAFCAASGRLLRGGRYAHVDVGVSEVRKRRAFYAPLLVRMGEPLVAFLGTGMTVLRQREWEEREASLYRELYGSTARIVGDGVLILPRLPGETLATILETHSDAQTRQRAIELAVVALAAFHRSGHTHADAMAENVLIDLEAGVARWFDFETLHDAGRSVDWRRADDLRALVATCILRTPHSQRARTVRLIIDAYAAPHVTKLLATSFDPSPRRPLCFHLGQAPLSYDDYREIRRLLQAG